MTGTSNMGVSAGVVHPAPKENQHGSHCPVVASFSKKFLERITQF